MLFSHGEPCSAYLVEQADHVSRMYRGLDLCPDIDLIFVNPAGNRNLSAGRYLFKNGMYVENVTKGKDRNHQDALKGGMTHIHVNRRFNPSCERRRYRSPDRPAHLRIYRERPYNSSRICYIIPCAGKKGISGIPDSYTPYSHPFPRQVLGPQKNKETPGKTTADSISLIVSTGNDTDFVHTIALVNMGHDSLKMLHEQKGTGSIFNNFQSSGCGPDQFVQCKGEPGKRGRGSISTG
jgi:hypothetical protein